MAHFLRKFSCLYRAYDTSLNIEVALEVPHPTGDPTMLDRFVREAQMLAKIRHLNVCQVYDVGQIEGSSLGSARDTARCAASIN